MKHTYYIHTDILTYIEKVSFCNIEVPKRLPGLKRAAGRSSMMDEINVVVHIYSHEELV